MASMPPNPSGLPLRRRRRQDFLLPDGKKVIVCMPEDLEPLRQQYADTESERVEVVLHGSDEHHEFLRQSHAHHQDRHRQLTEKHGRDLLEELQDVQDQLNSVRAEMERLTDNGALSHSFNKFGYHAALRTYDDDSSRHGSVSEPGSESTAVAWEDPRPGKTVKLFKKPVIRQWLHKGLLWRASEHTEIMPVELFFDLLYVGIIHINGEHVAESADGKELVRFIITFVMSWNIWSDITRYMSGFETDDVFTQVLILFEIVCLLALTTNMTYALDEGSHSTWVPLVTFYLAARLKNAIVSVVTGFALPMVRGFLILTGVCIALPSALWIGSIYVPLPARYALVFPALVLDLYYGSIIFALVAFSRKYDSTSLGKSLGRMFEFFPATNIEHRVERANAFVSLVFGYSVVGVMFQSNSPVVIDAFLGKSILGLIQAFLFNWIYFDIDGKNLHVHAIRRSGFSAGIWTLAHLPFVMSYILATAALSKIVLATDVPNADESTLGSHYYPLAEDGVSQSIRLIYCCGLAIAILSMNVISLTHEHRQPLNLRWQKPHRLANRVVVAIIFFGLPWASLTSQSLIAVSMSLILEILLVELWGTSCTDDPFIGERKGVCVRYKTHCCKRELKKALKEEQKRDPEKFAEVSPETQVEIQAKADILKVGEQKQAAVEEA